MNEKKTSFKRSESFMNNMVSFLLKEIFSLYEPFYWMNDFTERTILLYDHSVKKQTKQVKNEQCFKNKQRHFFNIWKNWAYFQTLGLHLKIKNGILEQNNLQWHLPPFPFRGIVQTILSTIKRRLVGTYSTNYRKIFLNLQFFN